MAMKRIAVKTLIVIGIIGLLGYGLLDHFKFPLYEAAMKLQLQAARITPRHIAAGDIDFAYLENDMAGKKPTLLLVHGFGAFKENWLDLAIQLKDDFHILIIDLPGHGASTSRLTDFYDVDRQVSRLHDFMQAVHPEPFTMVGNSMGGAITALYAGTYPDQVSHVVLLDPAGVLDVKSEYNRLLDRGENPLIVQDKDSFGFMLQFVMQRPPFIPWPLTDVSVAKMVARKPLNDKIFADITGTHAYDFKAGISRITAPTLIAWGDQDRVLAPGNADVFHQLIKGSTIYLFKDVGHAPMIEVPARCADVIRNFVTPVAGVAAR